MDRNLLEEVGQIQSCPANACRQRQGDQEEKSAQHLRCPSPANQTEESVDDESDDENVDGRQHRKGNEPEQMEQDQGVLHNSATSTLRRIGGQRRAVLNSSGTGASSTI